MFQNILYFNDTPLSENLEKEEGVLLQLHFS